MLGISAISKPPRASQLVSQNKVLFELLLPLLLLVDTLYFLLHIFCTLIHLSFFAHNGANTTATRPQKAEDVFLIQPTFHPEVRRDLSTRYNTQWQSSRCPTATCSL